jgi:hypothetical protein
MISTDLILSISVICFPLVLIDTRLFSLNIHVPHGSDEFSPSYLQLYKKAAAEKQRIVLPEVRFHFADRSRAFVPVETGSGSVLQPL